MMPNKKRRHGQELQAVYSKKALAGKLRRFADALDDDRPCVFQIKGVRVVIPVDASVKMEYEREGRQEEIEIDVEWIRPKGASGRPGRETGRVRSTGFSKAYRRTSQTRKR
jgi:amphi-Trp domain-containing protein